MRRQVILSFLLKNKKENHNMRKTITALDIESSAFDGYPIQIGVIREDKKTYESLIKPHEEWLVDLPWDYNAQCIHNIPQEKVIEKGRNIKVVAKELNDFLGSSDVFVDSVYDIYWLDLLFEFAEIKRTFHVFVLEKIMPEDFIIHWNAIFALVMKSTGLKLHNALSDAKMIQLTFERIAQHY